MSIEVQTYIDAVEDERRSLLLNFQAIILRLCPEAAIKISYQIPSYKVPTGWVFLGYWKQGVSIYTGYSQGLADFRAKHPRIKTGKGSVNFRLKDEIPWQDVETLIADALYRGATPAN